MTKTLLSVMLCCCCSIMAFGQNMTQEIEKIIKGKQASVGVAIIHNDWQPHALIGECRERKQREAEGRKDTFHELFFIE